MSVAVNTTHLFWVNRGDSLVMRAPKNGGSPVTVATASAPPISVDATDDWICWSDNETSGFISCASAPGGAKFDVADQQQNPIDVAIDGDRIYWSTDARILYANIELGAAATEVVSIGGEIWGVTFDEDALYWTSNAGVFKIAKPL